MIAIIKAGESYIRKLLDERVRIDGRALDQFRAVKIETGVITSAEGSARVKIGGSTVIAGVKLDAHAPYPDTPDEGFLVVDAELLPMASPTFEPGPPSPDAVELARVVDRGIRESHSIDTTKLVITPKELVWAVHVDIHVLDHDGNLIDAAELAAISALLTTKLPKYDIEAKRIIPREYSGVLPMKDRPVEVTVGKIGNILLVDAALEEDSALDARITIATNEEGDICALQKGGKGFFTTAELLEAVDIAVEKGKELRALLPQLAS
jgi:exosome complex component RRP42